MILMLKIRRSGKARTFSEKYWMKYIKLCISGFMMKLTSDSLLLKFLGYKIELFNIMWDSTDMTGPIQSGISVWFLLLSCIAKTVVCLFIPLVYIIVISLLF